MNKKHMTEVRDGSVKELLGHLWGGVRKTTKLAVQMNDLPREKLDENVLSGTGSSWTIRSGIVAGVRGFARLQNVQRASGAQETPGVLTRG